MPPQTRQIVPPEALSDAERVFFGDHRSGGRFFNPWQGELRPGRPMDLLRWKLGGNRWAEAKRQEAPIACDPAGPERFATLGGPKVLWLGHASFLIELDGFRALIDPVFGPAGTIVKRQAPAACDPDALPPVDAILITHGHYDHLDRASLERLRDAQPVRPPVLVPLGLAGVIPEGFETVEVDWWTAVDLGGVEAVLVPAQHWHRRGLFDTNRALWGGWVLRGTETLYHAGDSGFFDGFGVIGKVFEAIELAMLPVGAYEPRWFMRPQHMNPDESLQAFDRLGARHFVAMHWGTFDLTDEPLRQGARRLRELVDEQGRDPSRYHVPLPGGSVAVE